MVLPIISLILTGSISGGGLTAYITPRFLRSSVSDEQHSAISSMASDSHHDSDIISSNSDDNKQPNENEEETAQDDVSTDTTSSEEYDGEIEDLEGEMENLLALTLFDLAKGKQWNEIIRRSKYHERQAGLHCNRKGGCDALISLFKNQKKRSQLDENIISALFESCLHDPPPEIITALLNMSSNPRATLLFQNNATKSTLLHIACYAGVNLQVIRILIERCPDVVLKKNGIGWTPLHLLCWGTDDDEIALRRKEPNRELNIARMLLLRHPEQQTLETSRIFCRQKASHAIHMQDIIGWTPLHLACWGGASFELVELLLNCKKDSASIKTKDGWTPIHLACRYNASVDVVTALLKAAPQSATIKAKGGWCALHLACWWQSSTPVLKAILLAYPSAANIQTWEDYTPLEILWQRHMESQNQKYGRKNLLTTTATAPHTHLEKNDTIKNTNDELSEKISSLLHAANSQKIHGFSFPQNGSLHLVCAISAIVSNVKCPEEVKMFIMHRLSLLTEEEARDPEGGNRCSLLSVAIEYGASWEWGLETIFKAWPGAIYLQNIHSGLYPFMEAASSQGHIDTVYNLLRAAPFLVSNALNQ